MKVEIQVQNGKVTITVGGKATPKPAEDKDTLLAQGMLGGALAPKVKGGDAPTEDTATGGGGPSSGGVLVIGPIVVDCPGGTAGAASGKGGDAPTEDTATGGGGPGTGALVIGPIVFCGRRGGAAGSSGKNATGIAENPEA